MRRFTILTALLCCVGLTACGSAKKDPKKGGDKPATTGGAATKDPAGGSAEKVVNLAVGGDPETLDVGKMSGAPEGRIAFNAFEGLWMPAQGTGKPVYGVAESHTLSDDGKTWTIKIRKDAKWSNGDAVTAADFEFAWKRVCTPGFDADYAEFMDFIQGAREYRTKKTDDWGTVGVKVVDPQTLAVTLKNPTPFFPELMAFYTFFPVHKATVEKHGDSWTRVENIVTNGPYKLAEYKHQQYLLMDQNTHYHSKGDLKIDKVKIFIFKDNNAMLNAFKEGKIDVMAGGIPAGKIPVWRGKKEFRLDPLLGTYYYRIHINGNDALKKKEVRQALAFAIDRDSLANNTMKGLYLPAKGMVPTMDGHTPSIELKFDADKARELLAKAGYPEGKGFPETTLLFNTDENHKQIAERIQDMWKRELGVTIKLENKEWKTYLGDIDKLAYQVARAGWIGDYSDPTTFLGIFTTGNGNNDTGWGTPEYDALINGAYAEVDAGKRAEMLRKAEELLIEEAPVIPIMFYQQATLINPRLVGHKPHNRDIHLVKYMDIK